MSTTISELPHKEQAHFRSALKLYEARQYKRGLKTCEQILKKFPKHGETLAVKGLFLAFMDRREEGYETIRQGIEISPKSSISWHIFGIVQRTDQNYTEAIKCYEESLKADSENISMLRDLATMQTHMRQYDRLIETRQKITKLYPLYPSYWLGLAVAYQMSGKFAQALKTIVAHEGTFLNEPGCGKFEHSELLMYKNWLIELTGDHQQALENLKEIRPNVVDITGWKEQKANLLLKLDRKEMAAMAYQDLIERNPDNKEYVRGYLACNGLDMARSEDRDAVLEVISTLQQQFPSSNTLKFLPLTFCEGSSAEFAESAGKLIKHALRKGIPSLFTSMKILYADKAKGETLGNLVGGYETQLRDTKRFDTSTEDEAPSVHMWATFYLAQHWDYYGDHERALRLIDEAIKASPEVVELCAVKAKILKHAGDIHGARDTMDFARQMDLKDRFINSKAVKYMLRDNDLNEAEKTFIMFVSDEAKHKVQEILTLQTTWYMRERGNAYHRLGDIGRALKQYHQVQSVFDMYYNDQYDFHSYSLRKTTMRSYVDILRWEDQLYATETYVDVAHSAIECYLELHDLKAAGTPFKPVVEEKETKPMTRNSSSKHGQHNLSAGVGENKIAEVDKDPNGKAYVEAEDHLASALKFVEKLESAVSSHPKTHTAAFEVHLRMKKYFLALKSINSIKAIDAENASLIPMAARLIHGLDADESFAAPMKAALKGQLAKSFGDVSIENAIKANQDDLTCALIGAKGLLAIGGAANVAAAKDISSGAAAAHYGKTRTLENLIEAKNLLVKSGASEAELAEFTKSTAAVFPLATCF
ncbi:hypothetical protein GGI07_000191 [Coemansia sp. Benny D115]|nr:hypothetical protein GGI07_000191 [Coemansia sp. Benny D115]